MYAHEKGTSSFLAAAIHTSHSCYWCCSQHDDNTCRAVDACCARLSRPSFFPLRMSLVSRGWHVAPTYCIRCRVRGASRHAAVPEGLSQSRRAAVVAVRGVAATCRTSLRCGTSSKPPGRSAWWCSVLHGRCLPVKRRLPAKLASLSHVEGRCITNLLAAAKRTTTVPFDSPLPRLVLAREVCLGSSDELCLLGSSLHQHVLPASLSQQERSQIQCTMLASDFQGVASCFACSVSAHGYVMLCCVNCSEHAHDAAAKSIRVGQVCV